MSGLRCQILIVGGGTGGTAAALAAWRMGCDVILTEETDWVGGQLTAQAVPPDEHPWIEQLGGTRSYRAFRNGVREYYRANRPLRPEAKASPFLNPGGGWVSRLCAEPTVCHEVLQGMLAPALGSGRLRLLFRHKVKSAAMRGEAVMGATFADFETGGEVDIEADVVIDATELGDLLPLTGTAYVSGAESREETGEPNAVEGPPQPDNVQGLTWVFAMAFDHDNQAEPEKPDRYEFWRSFKPDFWPGPLLGFDVLHAHTGEPRRLPLFGEDRYSLMSYRQIVDPAIFTERAVPVTLVNWPQNDYFDASIIDVDPYEAHPTPGASGPISAQRLLDAQELSRSLLYWLQTEAPRHDAGTGYPECRIAPGYTGTDNGFAKYPYVRESRRIRAQFTILEQHVAAYTQPGRDLAEGFDDSVGIGAYRIDLHPSTNGAGIIDTSTLPFQIPLRSLIPIEVPNLLPGAKNIGTTHISNGCFRLHPVEWNIGEAAGVVAALAVDRNLPVQAIGEKEELYREAQSVLARDGVELAWPRLGPL